MISNWRIPDFVEMFQYRSNYNEFFYIWGSNNSDNENYCLPGCDTVWSGRRSRTFRFNEMIPSLGSQSEPSKQPTRSSQVICPMFAFCLFRACLGHRPWRRKQYSFRAWLGHRSWRWKQYSPLIRRQTSPGQHCITSQKSLHSPLPVPSLLVQCANCSSKCLCNFSVQRSYLAGRFAFTATEKLCVLGCTGRARSVLFPTTRFSFFVWNEVKQ
jgi:hypothetical protein